MRLRILAVLIFAGVALHMNRSTLRAQNSCPNCQCSITCDDSGNCTCDPPPSCSCTSSCDGNGNWQCDPPPSCNSGQEPDCSSGSWQCVPVGTGGPGGSGGCDSTPVCSCTATCVDGQWECDDAPSCGWSQAECMTGPWGEPYWGCPDDGGGDGGGGGDCYDGCFNPYCDPSCCGYGDGPCDE